MDNPYRILVVDDDASVRATYAQILQPPTSPLGGLEALIDGPQARTGKDVTFEVAEAAQGENAAALHLAATRLGKPFQLAFIDMRMPPGWDGMRTAMALRAQDPSIYIVIATAYSDYDVHSLQASLGHDVVLLRKPFNEEEVFQLARTLCQSWETRRRLEAVTAELESRVLARTAELDHRMAQQEALAEIATRFVELGNDDDPDDAVHWALARLGRLMESDIGLFFRLDANRENYRMTHEWRAYGIKTLKPDIQVLPRGNIAPAHARFLRDEVYSFTTLAELPEEMAHLRNLLDQRIEGGLAVPVEQGGQLGGFLAIGYGYPMPARDHHEIRLLRTAGHLIMSALEMHLANQRLARSEASFNALVRNIPGAVYRCALDDHWTAIYISDYIEVLSGYPATDFIGNRIRSYASLIHPGDLDRVNQEVNQAAAAHTGFVLDYRIRHADGSQRLVHERGQATYTADGEVIWLEGVITDACHLEGARTD